MVLQKQYQLICLFTLLTLMTGCLNTAQRGDRAYKAGDCEQALKLYEEAIKEKSRDPEVFYRAAQCATRLGGFTQAERYYSRSLRYGGGPKVAKALARLYIKTSNYARAVRVLQALLNDERVKPQPVYNNLGTALMYAGEPLDAESYLLIAQQMDPKDPFPYVNLGLLYDRHLRRPDLAMGFYTCYLTMGKTPPQGRSVKLRMYELKQAGHQPDQSVTCGKPYKHQAPKKNAFAELQKLKAKAKKEDKTLATTAKTQPVKDPKNTTVKTTDPQPKDNQTSPKKIVVDRGGDLPETSPAKTTQSGSAEDKLVTKVRQQAQQAFYDKKYRSALTTLNTMPTNRITAADAVLFAKTHQALKQNSEAEVWYRLAFQKQPDTLYFHSLVKFLKANKKTKQLKVLCAKHKGNDSYAAVLSMCP